MGEGSFGIVYEGFVYKGSGDHLRSNNLAQSVWHALVLKFPVLSDYWCGLLCGHLNHCPSILSLYPGP